MSLHHPFNINNVDSYQMGLYHNGRTDEMSLGALILRCSKFSRLAFPPIFQFLKTKEKCACKLVVKILKTPKRHPIDVNHHHQTITSERHDV